MLILLRHQHHITTDPFNLAVKTKFIGNEQLQVRNEARLQTANIGMSSISFAYNLDMKFIFSNM